MPRYMPAWVPPGWKGYEEATSWPMQDPDTSHLKGRASQYDERAVPGMAHFENTGPVGTSCGECTHWHPARRVCEQFIKLMGARAGSYRTAPQLKPTQPSCKYWQRR